MITQDTGLIRLRLAEIRLIENELFDKITSYRLLNDQTIGKRSLDLLSNEIDKLADKYAAANIN